MSKAFGIRRVNYGGVFDGRFACIGWLGIAASLMSDDTYEAETRTRGKQRFRGYCGDAEVSTKDLLGKTRLIKGEFGIEC